MSKTIIQVENLGKKYVLRHQQEGRSQYKSLREVISNGARFFRQKLIESSGKKHYNSSREEFWALKEVSFEINQGECVGIIGHNGAGKSTLLKILSRITDPTKGKIVIQGRVASLLEVGTGFHPELTGRENIFLNGAVLGMSKVEIKRKFDEIVEFAEVEKFLDTPVKHYSSGMYVRLAFAVAAHLEPEILIVDEVLAVGDAAFQKKCLGKMGDVAAKEGRTVLFVSHSMSSVQRLCNSAILLNHGTIVANGKVSDVINVYLKQANETIVDSLSWSRKTPSSAIAYFEKISLSDEKEEKIEYVTTATALKVTVDFVISQKLHNLQLRVGLLSDNKDQIFSSAPQDAGLIAPSEPGRYRAITYFPAELLFPKLYVIKAVLWSPDYDKDFDCVDALQFEVQETASLCNSTPYGRDGIILLRLNWEIKEYY